MKPYFLIAEERENLRHQDESKFRKTFVGRNNAGITTVEANEVRK